MNHQEINNLKTWQRDRLREFEKSPLTDCVKENHILMRTAMRYASGEIVCMQEALSQMVIEVHRENNALRDTVKRLAGPRPKYTFNL